MKSIKEEIQTIKTLLKDSRTAKYHKRLQIVLFRLMGKSYKEIIEFLDCNQTTIWQNVKKYEEFGLDSLLQETRGGRNHAYMTVEEEKAFLARHLKAAEAGEFVTIDALFQAYKKELGRSYTRDAFYQLLKRHGWRNITPRPEHPRKADAQTIVASKNKISIQEEKKKRFKTSRPFHKVRLMYQDEAGFGRISKLGSCWSPIGVGPHVHSHYIREFRYCYGAVDAHTGESFFLRAGGCNTEWMNVFLEELSQAYPDDYFLLVMDNAIWHKSSTLKIPTNIGFAFIPPYTPEMNPIEQVWKEIRKRGFKNKAFRTLEDVMNQLQDVIQGLEKEVIKSIVNQRWTRMLFESR
ncbi:TPA: IS630 family transposase [Streptococcus pneumoniae]|uniref:IS630 family transposase n=1 Tax=Streptococcus pneumoniae TaxID=1313 RepID=UPI000B58EF0E|nr:IS630 family transposase [Streptococcus pneumoniae]MDV8416905.1 IS630 family transposase [Streptococcus pneumoniae]MDV8482103.1 IS630 family transposase [Streptococcus pneumoniae]MDV8840835.1 IS630 family transposase [Streptococcus pneumoniae]MDV8889771.1 IS630 family transposase [Streptococcus pneumoniae]HES9656885.1 IS630 family transposase [Streptococcus pneumoniae]